LEAWLVGGGGWPHDEQSAGGWNNAEKEAAGPSSQDFAAKDCAAEAAGPRMRIERGRQMRRERRRSRRLLIRRRRRSTGRTKAKQLPLQGQPRGKSR
jgi:hypothetical protein